MPAPLPGLSLGFSSGPSTAVSGNRQGFDRNINAPLISNGLSGTDLILPAAIIGGALIFANLPKKRSKKRKP